MTTTTTPRAARVPFCCWGKGAIPDGYVLVGAYDTPIDAFQRRIERETGLTICGGPRCDGTAYGRGASVTVRYEMTLGRPCRGGGYTPSGNVWVSLSLTERSWEIK